LKVAWLRISYRPVLFEEDGSVFQSAANPHVGKEESGGSRRPIPPSKAVNKDGLAFPPGLLHGWDRD